MGLETWKNHQTEQNESNDRITLGVATAEEEPELSGRWAELQKQPREQLQWQLKKRQSYRLWQVDLAAAAEQPSWQIPRDTQTAREQFLKSVSLLTHHSYRSTAEGFRPVDW